MRHPPSQRLCLLLTAAVFSFSAPPAHSIEIWNYAHGKEGTSATRDIRLIPGEHYSIRISYTCSEELLVGQKAIPRVEEPPAARGSARLFQESHTLETLARSCGLGKEDVFLEFLHQRGVGAYVFTLNLKEGDSVLAVRGDEGAVRVLLESLAKEDWDRLFLADRTKLLAKTQVDGVTAKLLVPVTLIVNVLESDPLKIELAGGFTASTLTNPKYFLEELPGVTPQTFEVRRDVSAEDTLRLGLAGLIHVSHERVLSGIPALTFGLGIEQSNRVSYFFGLSARAFGRFFLTAGANLGSVDRLPTGLQEGSRTTDVNALQTLGTRTATGFFFAVSYAFLSPGEAFFKGGFQTAPDTVKTGKSE